MNLWRNGIPRERHITMSTFLRVPLWWNLPIFNKNCYENLYYSRRCFSHDSEHEEETLCGMIPGNSPWWHRRQLLLKVQYTSKRLRSLQNLATLTLLTVTTRKRWNKEEPKLQILITVIELRIRSLLIECTGHKNNSFDQSSNSVYIFISRPSRQQSVSALIEKLLDWLTVLLPREALSYVTSFFPQMLFPDIQIYCGLVFPQDKVLYFALNYPDESFFLSCFIYWTSFVVTEGTMSHHEICSTKKWDKRSVLCIDSVPAHCRHRTKSTGKKIAYHVPWTPVGSLSSFCFLCTLYRLCDYIATQYGVRLSMW